MPANAGGKPITETAKPTEIIYPYLWLVLAASVVYFQVFRMGVTELDDTIFIRDFQAYNEQISNLVTSFSRGLFDAVKDPYYRPLFLDSMVLNYWLANHGQNIFSYHLVNLLFHLASILLLYQLFVQLKVKKVHSFILAMFFAIHPVLTQAVAWIPGRNDTLLAVFVLAYLINAIKYTTIGKVQYLLYSILFLLLALFTKETAVFAAPVALVLLVYMLRTSFLDKRNITQYVLWVACFGIWFFARSRATVQNTAFSAQIFTDFVHRLPLVVQYIGKIFLPVNLSVFPMQDETVYYFGILSILFLAGIIYFNPNKNPRQIISGFAVFALFLLPALIVPAALNEQAFEHRLYLPIIGILLILPQTILLSPRFTSGPLVVYACVVAALFAGRTLNHERNFADPISFWTQAVETSPKSAFANLHLSEYEDNLDRKCALIRKAYQLNPKEKYVNFFYAEMMINTNNRDSLMMSEPYLLTEKGVSNFHKCNFYLARIAVERGDMTGAINYLNEFLKVQPEASKEGEEANNNLLLLYLNTKL